MTDRLMLVPPLFKGVVYAVLTSVSLGTLGYMLGNERLYCGFSHIIQQGGRIGCTFMQR